MCFLPSCRDYTPISSGGSGTTWNEGQSDTPVYRMINFSYWSDSSDFPVLAVVSVVRGETLQSIPVTSRSEMGRFVSIQLTTSSGSVELPLFEENLISLVNSLYIFQSTSVYYNFFTVFEIFNSVFYTNYSWNRQRPSDYCKMALRASKHTCKSQKFNFCISQ